MDENMNIETEVTEVTGVEDSEATCNSKLEIVETVGILAAAGYGVYSFGKNVVLPTGKKAVALLGDKHASNKAKRAEKRAAKKEAAEEKITEAEIESDQK